MSSPFEVAAAFCGLTVAEQARCLALIAERTRKTRSLKEHGRDIALKLFEQWDADRGRTLVSQWLAAATLAAVISDTFDAEADRS